MIADTVKADHECRRDFSLIQFVQQSLIHQRSVSEYLDYKHSSLKDRVDDLHEISPDQRLSFDQNYILEAAVFHFIQQFLDPLKRKLTER